MRDFSYPPWTPENIKPLYKKEQISCGVSLALLWLGIIGTCFGGLGLSERTSNMAANLCFFIPGLLFLGAGVGLGIHSIDLGNKILQLYKEKHKT